MHRLEAPKDRVQNSAFSRYPLLSSRLRVKLNSLNTESTPIVAMAFLLFSSYSSTKLMYARPNYNSTLSLYHEKDNRCSSFYGFFRFISVSYTHLRAHET